MKKFKKTKNQFNFLLSFTIVLSSILLGCNDGNSKENPIMKNENLPFYILALGDNWINESDSLMNIFSDSIKLNKFISNSVAQNKESLKHKKESFLEKNIYDNYRYSVLKSSNTSPKKIFTTDEVQILKKENLIGYILPHKGVVNYQRFLLTEIEINPLIFVGESVISLLKYRIQEIEGLRELANFLEVIDNRPFIIVIDKNLYFSLREKILTDL